MDANGDHTLTVTDGEATTHARVPSDLWADHVEDWLPVRLDVATREHFRKVTESGRSKAKAETQAGARRGIVTGDWLLEDADELRVLWGTEDAPLALEGEGLMIAGPQGAGKTTLGQQLVLALAGMRKACLGLPVKRERGKVLYLAMDRPPQIKHSFLRMITEEDRELLKERIVLWLGPLPFTITKEPTRMVQFALEHGATHVVADSYKDMAPNLSDEETGAKINEAVQECIAEGVGWTGLHHNRKANAENKHPNKLSDIYGSGWLTAGLGSVISIYGEAGDELVEGRHLKPPAESFGTFGIRHDHKRGVSTLTEDKPVLDGRKKGKAARQEAVLDFLQERPELATPNDVNAKAIKEALGLDTHERTIERDIAEVAPKVRRTGSDEEVSEHLAAKGHEEDW